MVNRITLIGNLGRDIEVINTQSGSKIAKFSLATSENYKNKQGEWESETQWHDIVCFGQLAEKAERSLKKGSRVYVEGKVTYGSYEAKDGSKRYTTDIRANYFRSLDKREENTMNSPQANAFENELKDLPFLNWNHDK